MRSGKVRFLVSACVGSAMYVESQRLGGDGPVVRSDRWMARGFTLENERERSAGLFSVLNTRLSSECCSKSSDYLSAGNRANCLCYLSVQFSITQRSVAPVKPHSWPRLLPWENSSEIFGASVEVGTDDDLLRCSSLIKARIG